MSREFKVVLIVAVAALVGAAAIWFGISAWQSGGPAFDAAFERDFRTSCVQSASDGLKRSGQWRPETQAAVEKQCACALDVVRPLPRSEKIALSAGGEKADALVREIQRRCVAPGPTR